jgi:hypothetical protein
MIMFKNISRIKILIITIRWPSSCTNLGNLILDFIVYLFVYFCIVIWRVAIVYKFGCYYKNLMQG